MKPVKSYEEFKSELIESKQLDESISSVIKGALEKIGEFFKGMGSNFLNAIIKQEKGELPACVTIIPSKSDIETLAKHGKNIKRPSLSSLRENIDTEDEVKINEEKLMLNIAKETGIGDVDGKGLHKVLYTAVHSTQGGEVSTPVLVWGAPGIGKSAIIEKVAEEFSFSESDMRLIKVDLLTMNPEDLFLPYKSDTEKGKHPKSGRAPADWLPVYHVSEGKKGDEEANVDGRGGILFFDEIIRAKAPVKDAILTLLDSQRRIGQYKLGSKWTIIAAANRLEDEPDRDIEKTVAFLDRFDHVNYSPKFEDWEKWALASRDADGELIIMPEIVQFVKWWGRTEEEAQKNAVGHGGGKYFYDVDTTRDVNANPRAWEKASRALRQMKKALKALSKSDDYEIDRDELVMAIMKSVGKATAEDFANFLDMMRSVSMEDIQKIYNEPEKSITLKSMEQRFKDEKQSDITMRKISFLMTLAAAKAGQVLTETEIKNLCEWLSKPENKDNRLITTFLAAFIEGAHPYLRTSPMTPEQVEDARKTDKDIDKKVEMRKYFYGSAEGKKLINAYEDIFGMKKK